MTVEVAASDVEGPIASVALYRGTTLLGEDTEAPYAFALSVTLEAGVNSATLTVNPLEDAAVEGKETVVVTLVADAAYQLVSEATATMPLFDDEKPELRISAVDAAASESGTNPGALAVTAIPAPKVDLAVSFTVGGTATNGMDYAALASAVTVPAGAISVTLAVTPTDDAVPEATETISVSLSAQEGYQLGSPSSATVNLADDEPTVSVSASDNAAAEPGTNTGRFTLTVTPSDDTTPEGTETVILSVTAGGYRTGTASATVSLTDNE